MKNLLGLLRASVFPELCPYCNRTIMYGFTECDECRDKLPPLHIQKYANGGYPCASRFYYEEQFAEAVKRFKFRGYKQYAASLATQLFKAVEHYFGDEDIDVVTFVPMHKKRKRLRGYNQAELLARELAKLMILPCEPLLYTAKNNPVQHKCDTPAKRRDNVKGVYKPTDKERIKGRRILVVDDIFTSGYTLGECCKVLEKAGARKLFCATVCASKEFIIQNKDENA